MINTLQPGAITGQITGQVINPKQPKSGSNAQGAWKLQFATFRDATGEVDFKVWGHDDLVNGGTYVLTPNSQGGGIGMNITERQKRQIEVKASASCLLTNGQPPAQGYQQQAPAQQGYQQAPAPTTQYVQNAQGGYSPQAQPQAQQGYQQAPPAPPAPPAPAPAPAIASREIRAAADLMILAYTAMHTHVAPSIRRATGMELSAEQIQAAAASLFIESARNGATNDSTSVRKALFRKLAESDANYDQTPAKPAAGEYDQTRPEADNVDQGHAPDAPDNPAPEDSDEMDDDDESGIPF